MARSLDHVDELAAAVVALAGVALGVLVGEDRARASSTASDTKFSEAIISSCEPCRRVSFRMASATSGSMRARFSMANLSLRESDPGLDHSPPRDEKDTTRGMLP